MSCWYVLRPTGQRLWTLLGIAQGAGELTRVWAPPCTRRAWKSAFYLAAEWAVMQVACGRCWDTPWRGQESTSEGTTG